VNLYIKKTATGKPLMFCCFCRYYRYTAVLTFHVLQAKKKTTILLPPSQYINSTQAYKSYWNAGFFSIFPLMKNWYFDGVLCRGCENDHLRSHSVRWISCVEAPRKGILSYVRGKELWHLPAIIRRVGSW
jgi:hypothetical protein